MRICLIYDCLFPYTVGGAERWYRNLAERLAADGHEVEYLTLRQWDRDVDPALPEVTVRAVGPRMGLYSRPGRRRIAPPLVFGFGVLWHLLRHGHQYDVVHTASFPYFSLLAAGAVRPFHRFQLIVDWHEVWTRTYWREYLGRVRGDVGWLVQLICLRLPQRAFCFSNLHARRLVNEGLHGTVTTLAGEYGGPLKPPSDGPHERTPTVVFAGRHIPEKRVATIPPAIREARRLLPDLRGLILGDGPDREAVLTLLDALELREVVDVPGFVASAEVDHALAGAMCLLLPSRREGYGMVVVEAARHGTPSIVVEEPDNAAVELIEDGVNGFVACSATSQDLTTAILRVQQGGERLRSTTRSWFLRNSERLSLADSVRTVVGAYEREPRLRS